MLFFVFFKQKTAYEMRISDWSSDVCSSDLFDRGGKGRRARRRRTIHSVRHTALRGDLGRDLGARQQPAMPRLGALAQLDLGHPDLLDRGLVGELVGIEAPLQCPAAEIARAQLPHEIAAVLEVIGRQSALAGVVVEAADLGALVERLA